VSDPPNPIFSAWGEGQVISKRAQVVEQRDPGPSYLPEIK